MRFSQQERFVSENKTLSSGVNLPRNFIKFNAVKKLNFIPGWLKNKYFLTAFGFAVWMIFFDQQDLITTQVKQRNELNSLKASRDYYKQEIEATRLELEQLKSDPAVLEKYAREKYRMKRDNEDVFIVSDSLR